MGLGQWGYALCQTSMLDDIWQGIFLAYAVLARAWAIRLCTCIWQGVSLAQLLYWHRVLLVAGVRKFLPTFAISQATKPSACKKAPIRQVPSSPLLSDHKPILSRQSTPGAPASLPACPDFLSLSARKETWMCSDTQPSPPPSHPTHCAVSERVTLQQFTRQRLAWSVASSAAPLPAAPPPQPVLDRRRQPQLLLDLRPDSEKCFAHVNKWTGLLNADPNSKQASQPATVHLRIWKAHFKSPNRLKQYMT